MKKILSFTILYLMVLGNIFSQKPSERRKIQQEKNATDAIQEEEEEETGENTSNKKLTPSELRKKRQEKIKTENRITEFTSDFELSEVPEIFKKYSAVILAQSIIYEYNDSKFTGLQETRILRRRVAIRDQSALEAFSIFYTRKDANYKIEIIKPNGTKNQLSKSAAQKIIPGNLKIPDFFFEFLGQTDTILNLPIKGLEIGDIIDIQQNALTYSWYTGNPFATFPYVELLASNLPIVKQRFGIFAPPDYKIQLYNLNGCPKPDIRFNTDSSCMMVITDSFRLPLKKEYFNFVLRSEPLIKFMLNYNFKNKANICASNSMEIISKTEIIELANLRETPNIFYQTKIVNSTIDYLKSQNIPPNAKEELIRKAYYFIRTITLVRLDSKESYDYIDPPSKNVKFGAFESLNEDFFLFIMKEILDKYKIDYLEIVGISKKYGNIAEIVHQNEIIKGLKINGEKPIYLFNITQNSNLYDSYPLLEGTDLITFVKTKNKGDKKFEISQDHYPESSADDNSALEISTITLGENFENLLLQKTFEIKGILKNEYSDYALFERSFVEPDLEKIGRKIEEKIISKNIVRQEAYLKTIQDEKDKFKEQGLVDLKKMFENQNFDVEKVSDLKVISDGRFEESPILIFKLNTEFKNLISKAGPNYIVSIGALIGSQLELKSEDMVRFANISQNYRRTFKDELNFVIPEGYTIEDIRGLNMKMENESISFLAVAEIKGNILQIKVTKTYKNQFDLKDSWPNYVKVLEASYEFHQKKIVLTKLN